MTLRLPAPGFRGRLLAAMLTVVIVTSVSIAGFMMFFLFEDEETRAADQLGVAEVVAREVVDRRTELLLSNLKIVAEDFGFKSAIATRDLPTITSALENHSARAGTRLAMLADSEGRLIANLHGLENQTPMPFRDLLEQAQEQGTATAILGWQNRAYQVLMVPIQGPGLRAWLAAGFPLDEGFARFISDLTSTDVIFKYETGGQTRILASSLPKDKLDPNFMARLGTIKHQRLVESTDYFVRALTFDDDPDSAVQALLLSNREAALENYYRLALEMVLLVGSVLLIAVLLVIFTARALGRPVLQLAEFASAFGKGQDPQPPEIRAGGELLVLRNALSDMLFRIRAREHRIRHNASHDELTGLPNRIALEEELRQWMTEARQAWLIGFSLVDLKTINETLGYEFGGQAIVASGLRLRGQLPADSHFGRTGGNEFIALVPGLEANELKELLSLLKQRAESPVRISDTPVNLHLSMAAIKVPEDASTMDEVRRRLSLTLERANQKESRTAFYQPGGDENHLRELRLIRDLHEALANNSLCMNYQPKVRFEPVQFIQVEALIRWQHPELGFINPEEFIRLAESSGQIHKLTQFILQRIARDTASWLESGLDIGVAINLSALDLTNHGLPEEISRVFSQWHNRMNRLTFEITESAVMKDTNVAVQTLEKLRDLGVRLSVDDFGTGYSSLAQLRQLPVHELKIDKSFVLQLDTQPQDQLIVRSTIDMAHGLGLSVVAEGIENIGSWKLLQAWGCDLAQGFYLGRPMPPEDIAGWSERFRGRLPEFIPASGSRSQESLP